MPGFPVLRYNRSLLKLKFMMPSSYSLLSPPPPPVFNLSQHQGLSQWIGSASGSQNIGASISASVLPVNIQDSFLLRLTGLISLLSKGLSRVFSGTKVKKHQFFGAQTSLWFNSHIILDYWKNHSFDYMETNMFTFILCVFHPSSLPSSFLRVSQ